MATLPEAIVTLLKTEFPTIHVGQDVPQQISTDFIFFQRQGDQLDDSLKYPPTINAVLYDFECVSTNISSCRTLTENVKTFLSTEPLNSVVYDTTKLVHCFDVEDHDDSYIPHLVQLDAKLHIGSFRVTAYLNT